MLPPHHEDFEEFEALPAALHIGGMLWDDVPDWVENEPPLGPNDILFEPFVTSAVYTRHTALHRPITEWEQETRKLEPGDRVVEYMPDDAYHTHDPPPGLYCVVSGRLKLVVTHGGETRVISQCRRGQLLGVPRVLRMYLGMRDVDLPWPLDTTVEAVALEGESPEVRFIPLAVAFDMLDKRPDFRRYLVNQLEVRFIHRRRILALFAQNHILRYILPHDREYLLQLGGLRRLEFLVTREGEEYRPSACYLAAGKRSGRAGLLLEGEADMFRPLDGGRRRYVGKIQRGELLGHEAILEGVEPPRETLIELARGSEVFELSWYALRSALYQARRAEARVARLHLGIALGTDAPVPRVIVFQAARAGLDVTTLAYGMAAVLAHDAGAAVHLVDTGGEASFRRMVEVGPGQIGIEHHAGQIPIKLSPSIAVPIDQSTGGVPTLRVAWPNLEDGQPITPADVEAVIDHLLDDPQEVIQWIVVVHDPGSGPASASFARELADQLNLRSGMTFFVSDDTEAPYDLAPEVPSELTWVYRMNAAYMERERGYVAAHPEDSLGARMPLRRVVRVPEKPSDPLLAPAKQRAPAPAEGGVCEAPRLARAFDPEIIKKSPLARAFHRLARVVEGRTVGLALSGGGAWGFAHMPLIAALEEQGIPIDYVTGTSFGSVVGAIYAAGGTGALRTFVKENCAKPGAFKTAGTFESIRMVLGSELTMATFMLAPVDSTFLQNFIDRTVARYSGAPSLLTTTEVPFYPVGTDLDSQREMFNVRKSVGWGVRMSGAMPPTFPAVEVSGDGREPPPAPDDERHFIYRATPPRARDSHHIVDGAFIANVPSRVARQVGAHFVIASNVIPPAPGDPQHFGGIVGFLQWVGEKCTPQGFLRRADDLNRGTFLQTWKGGDDQGSIWADYRVTLQPQGYQFFEMWLGADMWEAVANVIEVRGIRQIRERWEALHPRLAGRS